MTTRNAVSSGHVRRTIRHVSVWIRALLFTMLAWVVAIRIVATVVR